MMTIAKYWYTLFERTDVESYFTSDNRWRELDSDEWPLDSVCGHIARRSIDKAFELISVMGERDEKAKVLHAVQDDILVVCFG